MRAGEQGYARQGYQRRYAVPVATLPSLPGERRPPGSLLLLVFETVSVIVAALRNKTDTGSSSWTRVRTHTLWLLPNCNVTVAESYEKFVTGSGGCTVYTSPGSCVETIVVTVRLSSSAVVGVRTTDPLFSDACSSTMDVPRDPYLAGLASLDY